MQKEKKKKITQMYDIALLPSIAFETFGLVNLEAMACSKPVIASNFSGIPEVVKDRETGILVPPRDSEALADAIIELLNDPEKRKQMGEAGRKRVEEMFTLEKMLNATYGLYEELLKEKGVL